METYYVISPWSNLFLKVDMSFYEKLKSYLIYKEIQFMENWYLLVHKETGCIVAYRYIYE